MANRGFIRFVDITKAQAATVGACFASLTAFGNSTGETVNLTLGFAKAEDQAAPTDLSELAALTMTTATVAWSPGPWTDGEVYLTPDLKDPLQEIFDQEGWASGNAVVLILEDNSSDSNAFRLFSAIEYSSGSEKAALFIA
jgi:hypothetical protein